METSLYKISFKDGRVFNILCTNKKQNKDILHFICQKQKDIKKDGQVVVERGIHTMMQFKRIMMKL